MKLALLALALAQAVPSPAPTSAPAAVEEWSGTFADGLREVRVRAERGEHERASALALTLAAPSRAARWCEEQIAEGGWRARAGRAAQAALDALELAGPPPAVRAEAHHARAVAFEIAAQAADAEPARAAARVAALQALERARLDAGPGELRLSATADQGALLVAAAEELRAKIPEISGQPPPPPAASAAPGADEKAPPDPLQLARAAYLAARERLIERLRMDWRAPDAQANAELVQRRLRELDELQRKREEEQQKKDEEQRQKDQQQQSGEPGDQKPEEQKPENQDPKDEPPKEEPEKEEPKDPQQPDESEPKPQQQQKPEEAQPMSKEELQKLLERLQQIDQARDELQRRLQRQRRIEVPEDW